MKKALNRIFKLSASSTDIKTEVIVGATTFMTMTYIIFVQPAILSMCGMDFKAVMAATCISSAIACFVMAFLSNYPVAAMPFCGFSITEGISFGFISFSFLKLISGRKKDVRWLVYFFSALFILRYLLLTG